MDSLERFLLIASSDDVTQAIDFAALDRVAAAQRTQVGRYSWCCRWCGCGQGVVRQPKLGCTAGGLVLLAGLVGPLVTSASHLHSTLHACPCVQYLGMALQNVLRQYTNAAASIVSELLSFTTKFAIQVRGVLPCQQVGAASFSLPLCWAGALLGFPSRWGFVCRC